MKKIVTGIITCCLALVLTSGALAADQKEQVDVYEQNKLLKSVVFVVGKSEYFVNNQIPGKKMDASHYITKDRTFVRLVI